SRPAPSSRRRSRQAAIPPMFPICRSITARSGGRSCTAVRTSAPVWTSRTVVSGSTSAASTSSLTKRASVAMRTSAMSPFPAGALGLGPSPPGPLGGRVAQAPRRVRSPRRVDPGGGSVLQIELEEGDGYTICRPIGELDAYTVGQFREALGELASRPKLLLDMSGVPFVDAAGLGALIRGIRRAREGGGDVAVCCHRPTLVRLLHTTGFDRIVTVAETLEEAAASLGDDQPANM